VAAHPNRILALVVVGVGLVAVVAAILAATRDGSRYDRGTPTGAVQAYLSAVLEGDHQQAARLLSKDSSCDLADLDHAYVPEGTRVVLRRSEIAGDTAQVVVDVVATNGVFSQPVEQHTLELTRAGDRWLVTGTPWPMFECEKG